MDKINCYLYCMLFGLYEMYCMGFFDVLVKRINEWFVLYSFFIREFKVSVSMVEEISKNIWVELKI